MEPRRKRARWIVAATVGALALTVVLLSPWSATATTGAPVLTLNLTKTAVTITGTGNYSDPQLVCVTSGKTVSWSAVPQPGGGPKTESGTTTTDGSGNYTFTTGSLSNNTTYDVTVTVLGSLSGGYGGGDVCPNVSTTRSITL